MTATRHIEMRGVSKAFRYFTLQDLSFDLEPGQEDEEDEAELGEHLDHLVELGPAEHVRPDDDAETDLDDHAREPGPAPGQIGDERAERRDGHDQHERAQRLGLHARRV